MAKKEDELTKIATGAFAEASTTAPTADQVSLPMPCHYLDTPEWKPGTIVQFVMSGRGLQAVVKPDDSTKFATVDVKHVQHGSVKPESIAS